MSRLERRRIRCRRFWQLLDLALPRARAVDIYAKLAETLQKGIFSTRFAHPFGIALNIGIFAPTLRDLFSALEFRLPARRSAATMELHLLRRFASVLFVLLLGASALAWRKSRCQARLTIDGVTYTEVVYTGHDAARVKFRHASWIGSVPIRDLPKRSASSSATIPQPRSPRRRPHPPRGRPPRRKTSASWRWRRRGASNRSWTSRSSNPPRDRGDHCARASDGVLIESPGANDRLCRARRRCGAVAASRRDENDSRAGLVGHCALRQSRRPRFSPYRPRNLVDGGSWRGMAYSVGTTQYRDEDGLRTPCPSSRIAEKKRRNSREAAAVSLREALADSRGRRPDFSFSIIPE